MKVVRVKTPIGTQLRNLKPGDTYVFPLGGFSEANLYMVMDPAECRIARLGKQIPAVNLKDGKTYVQSPTERVAPVDAEVTYHFVKPPK